MKLHKRLIQAGWASLLISGPGLAWAAEGGSPVGDNLVVLGIAAAVIGFALFSKSGSNAAPPAAAPVVEPPATEAEPEAGASEEAAPEAEAPAAEAATEEAPAEAASESSENAG